MEFIAILLMLLPAILWLLSNVTVLNKIWSAILWLQSSVPVLNKIRFAISWLFSAPNDTEYIQKELAEIRGFLEKAEADPETAKNKSELISQIRELANDAEDCLNEFKRLLIQPTDQEIFGHLLIFLRDRAGPWFLKFSNWLLKTGAGHLFCGAVACYFLGIGTCARFLRIVLELGTGLFVRTAVDIYNSLPKAGLELGFPLLIRTSLDPLLRTGHLHLTDHEIVGLFLRIGDLLWSTGAVACFLKISTCFLVQKISGFFLRTQLQRLSTRFLESARTRILRVGPVLRTTFEHDTYWLRTGVEFSTCLLRNVHAQCRIKMEVRKLKASVKLKDMRNVVIPMASNAGRLLKQNPNADRLLKQYSSRLDTHFIQDSELIGIEESRDKLLDILLDENKKQTCVLTVVGCAGLGKTALVRNVFDSQRLIDGGSFGPFTCRAWITVSPSFELVGFLKKMFRNLSPDDYNPEWDAVQLNSKVKCHLRDRRYLIVIDGVLTVDAWKYIKKVFPDNMKGSRVIVTTRYMKIAQAACFHNQEHYVCKLPTLSTTQSKELFCKVVFRGDSCPPHLKSLSENILKICRGVPLAIKSIGGVLSRKPASTVDWMSMLDHLDSGLQTEPEIREMMQIMSLSYNAQPDHHLERCFLHLSVSPEDYEIDSRQLGALRMIAGGMIGHHNEIRSEVAESNLNELISRSMIQAAEISDRVPGERCRVHDGMLEFTVKESVEQHPWTTDCPKKTLKQHHAADGALVGGAVKKRRISPKTQRVAGACWTCGEEGHYKDECPYLRCRYRKKLGHPNSSEKLRRPVIEGIAAKSYPVVVLPTAPASQMTHPWNNYETVCRNTVISSSMGMHDTLANKKSSCVFIPMSDQAHQDKAQLCQIIGVIYPGHGSPTKEEIVEGLRAISVGFTNHTWTLTKTGNQFLARFPSAEGLNHAVGRTSIPCRGHNASFTVYRWTGEEDVFAYRFPYIVWLAVTGFPLQCWNQCDLSKLLVKFAHVVDVSEQTLDRSDLEAAHVLVGCQSLAMIPSQVQAIVGNTVYNVRIRIAATLTEPGRGDQDPAADLRNLINAEEGYETGGRPTAGGSAGRRGRDEKGKGIASRGGSAGVGGSGVASAYLPGI